MPEVVLATASPAPATRIAPATAPAIVAPGRAAIRIDKPRNPRPSFALRIAPPVLPGEGRNRSGAILCRADTAVKEDHSIEGRPAADPRTHFLDRFDRRDHRTTRAPRPVQ